MATEKNLMTAFVLAGLMLPLGAHRLYLNVGGWWLYPLGFAAAIYAGVLGFFAVTVLIQLCTFGLFIYDIAHIAGWAAACAERTTTN